MNRSWLGPVVAGSIVLGVAGVLISNFQPGRPSSTTIQPRPSETPGGLAPSSPAIVTGNAREYPIGDPVVKHHIQVAAVWLAGVSMEGMASVDDVIHLEADIQATEGNPNGFAKDEFVPYLKITFALVEAAGGATVASGPMTPMVASDGLHYGASVAMPKAGQYRLTYRIEPPSAGGLGRHVGLGGVATWWEPFTTEFDWTVEPPQPPATASRR